MASTVMSTDALIRGKTNFENVSGVERTSNQNSVSTLFAPPPVRVTTLANGKECNAMSETKSKEKVYLVGVREIWVQEYKVIATSEKEAMNLIDSSDPDLIDAKVTNLELEYSHTMGSDTWTVEEEKRP